MAPTQPNEFLNREGSVRNSQPLIEASCPLLREIINFGTRVFDAAQKSTANMTPSQPLPLLVSYLHILEMADGIEVLLSQCSVNPAIPLVRSMFESNLAIEYMLRERTEDRSFDWLFAYFRARKDSYEANSPETDAGRRLQSELQNQPRRMESKIDKQQLDKAISNVKRILDGKHYKEAAGRSAKKRKDWYSAAGGPTTLRDLAKHLGYLWDYEVLYRKWSSIVHGVDLSRFLARSDRGGAAFFALRNPKEFTSIAFLSAAIVLQSTRSIGAHYQINFDLKDWYLSEVRERWFAIQAMQIEFVEREVDVDSP